MSIFDKIFWGEIVSLIYGVLFLSVFTPLIAQDSLEVHLDYARFRGGENLTYIEIYYAVNRSFLRHVFQNGEYVASYKIQLEIVFKDSTIKSVEWQRVDKVAALEQINKDQSINDVHQLVLGEGTFRFILTITDLTSMISASRSVKVDNPKKNRGPVYISDLQLALSLNSTSEKSRFIKNGFRVVPNPSRTYNLNWPVLFYYSEIYKNSDTLMSSDILCHIKEEIIDAQGNTVKTLPVRQKNVTSSGIVNINKTPVSALQSGMYDLRVEILGDNNQRYDTKTASFYVYRPVDFVNKGARSSPNYDELYTFYLTFSESDLDAEFEQASYIVTSQDTEIYDKLGPEDKRKFLVEFWARQSDSSERDARATRANYLERVNYANDRFTSGSDPGWKTDRGRVAILYGIPDDVEKYIGGSNAKQHEVWTYNELENGVKFIFVDVTGYGKYRLVHSTMHNEVKDYEWQDRYLKQ